VCMMLCLVCSVILAGFVCGKFSAQKLFDTPNGVAFDYGGGDDGRTAWIVVECDAGAADFGWVVNNPKGSLEYNITGKSKLACNPDAPKPSDGPSKGGGGGGKKKKLSGGWIFNIIVLVGGFVYLVGGMVFKSQRLGAAGAEMVPNIEMWRGLPGLIKDGFGFIKEKITGKKSDSSYQTMP
jgi:hypothetical protein